MSQTNVTANVKAHDHSVSADYDFGADIDEATKLFGSEVVHSLFRQAAIVNFQALLRRNAVTDVKDDAGKPTGEVILHTSEEVAAVEAIINWKPGVSTRITTSPREKAMAALAKMSSEDRLALLAELEDDEVEEE